MGRSRVFDVVIVGAGPAGIFCALEIIENKPHLKILILEKGNSLSKRVCPSKKNTISCLKCSPCAITAGWGGAGAFSDGKLNLGLQMVGWLPKYIDQKTYEHFLEKTDKTWLKFGAPQNLYGVNSSVKNIEK